MAHTYEDIISMGNLLEAWTEFLRGKRSKEDVQGFTLHLMDNIWSLRSELNDKTYRHGPYEAFNVSDPKPRSIHKAPIRDRLLHHALYRVLYPFFDRTFIADSFSCREDKGTHAAINRFQSFFCRVSKNNKKTCWVLQCDIRKFFASIDHNVLMEILRMYIPDRNIIWLLNQVIESFSTKPGTGLPLGNLTSQLLVNIYMNEFDQFVKHKLRAKYYVRYADDFVILSGDRKCLEVQLKLIQAFLQDRLRLTMHPDKVFIQTLAAGVDFLGWVHFPNHRVLRGTTRRRMKKNLSEHSSLESINSYLGLLSHGNTYSLQKWVYEQQWLNTLEEG